MGASWASDTGEKGGCSHFCQKAEPPQTRSGRASGTCPDVTRCSGRDGGSRGPRAAAPASAPATHLGPFEGFHRAGLHAGRALPDV